MGPAPARVERIVDAALECSVRSWETPDGGRVADTYLLGLDGDPGRAVCKIGGPSVRTRDVIEPLVLRLVADTTDLPVPAVLATGTVRDGDGAEDRWALYEFLDGRTPTPYRALDAPVRRRIVAEAGSILGRLHAAHPFDRTGGLARDGDRLVIRDPDGVHFPERGRRLARRHPACREQDWQPVLTHGDLFPGNLLVDESGGITGLVDWGNAHVTTAGYALARAEMRFVDWFRFPGPERRRLRGALRTGYRRHRPLPPDYRTLAGAYKALWLAQSVERVFRVARTGRGRRQYRRQLRNLWP